MTKDEQPRRRPDASPSPSLGEIAVLPVFFRLSGKPAIVAGGGDGAAWKAELLAAAGARVTVMAAQLDERMRGLVERAAVVHERRGWSEDDLAGAAMAICEARDDDEARSFAAAAHRAGVPVNVIDRPEFCDFQFGAIVERSPLVIGISTDGAAPVFGQEVRARIESLLPDTLRHWAAAAKAWRPEVMARRAAFRARRAFWERFAKKAFEAEGRGPVASDLEELLVQLDAAPAAASATGSVVLVGAGPGDPDLLTVKAIRALQSADVILYDDLVSPRTVAAGRREAEKIAVGKRGYKPSCTQEDITALMVSLAKDSKRVVRLKGGDPMIFGRAGEEIAGLRAAGVPVEIVPGVTAAAGAAASLRMSLTERDLARRVQFITAHARDGKLPGDLSFAALADPRATTVVYMGVRTLAALSARLQAEGLDPETPAVLIERATWPDERDIRGTIGSLPDLASAANLVGPCLVIIGAAVRSAGSPGLEAKQ